MKTREVERIVAPNPPHFVGDGFRVHNFIPSIPGIGMHRMNPIIMLDYNSKFYFEPSDKPKGVGVHPHRGFETVTIAYHGKISHHDSAGGGGTIEQGGVQWMTAGSGVLHKEYHEKEFSKKGGDFQMVQLWVNLPAKHKMTQPKYQAIDKHSLSTYMLDDSKGHLDIIAGEYRSVKGPAETFTEIHLYNLTIKKSGKIRFDFPKHFHTALLAINGNVMVNADELKQDHFCLMDCKGEHFDVSCQDEEATVLIMSGEPINESIAAHGPFVMNTKDELVQAMQDFENGKFGVLEE